MKFSGQIKPISWLKSNASDVIRNIDEPLIITQNGEAKAVVQSVESYERTQETLSLLKILALDAKEIEKGDVTAAEDVFGKLRRG